MKSCKYSEYGLFEHLLFLFQTSMRHMADIVCFKTQTSVETVRTLCSFHVAHGRQMGMGSASALES